jgi:hypothetical protein
MGRIATMMLAFLLATGCASVARLDVTASAEPSQAAVELECMADCLDEDGASCDECAVRCFSTPANGAVVSLSH